MVWAHFLWQAGCFIWEAAVAESEAEARKRELPHGIQHRKTNSNGKWFSGLWNSWYVRYAE